MGINVNGMWTSKIIIDRRLSILNLKIRYMSDPNGEKNWNDKSIKNYGQQQTESSISSRVNFFRIINVFVSVVSL